MEGIKKRSIKLIWEFYGEDAKANAEHHAKHLKEYSERVSLGFSKTGIEDKNSLFIAYLIVKEDKMIQVRDALRPKRGEWVEG